MPGKKKTQQKKFVKKGSKKQVNKKLNRKLSRKQYKKRRTIKKRGGDKEKHANILSTIMNYSSSKIKETPDLKAPESKLYDIKYQLNYHHRIQHGCTDENGKKIENPADASCKDFQEAKNKIKNDMAKYTVGYGSTFINAVKSLSSRIRRRTIRNDTKHAENLHNKTGFLIQFSKCMKLYKTKEYDENKPLQDKIDFIMYIYFVLVDQKEINNKMRDVNKHIDEAANKHDDNNNHEESLKIIKDDNKKIDLLQTAEDDSHKYLLSKKSNKTEDQVQKDEKERELIHENYRKYCEDKNKEGVVIENKLTDIEVEELIDIYLHDKNPSNNVIRGGEETQKWLAVYGFDLMLCCFPPTLPIGVACLAITYFTASAIED